MNEYKVEVETEEGSHRNGSLTYKHPSYGMINVCRYQGGKGEFFGSDLDHSGGIRIEIGKASVQQDLGRNWYYDYETVVSVEMSAIQYAEMISSPNTQGVPCTIRYSKEYGHIQYAPPMPKAAYVESKIKSCAEDAQVSAKNVLKQVQELLKGKITAADRDKVIKLVSSLSANLNSSLPFYLESLEKEITRTKLEAKVDIESAVLHAITEAGYESIQAGDKVFKIDTAFKALEGK